MKKFAAICVFIFVGVLCFAGSDELDMYSFLYSNSKTHQDQLSLLQGMAERKLSGAGDFYANALNALVKDYTNIKGANEMLYAENQAILLASLVGQEKYSGAADDLWKLYNLFSDPLVKAEALMSLGKIQAVQYLPQVIKVLENLTNNAPGRDHLSGERVAFGAIIALEKYGNMDGYLPVYFASKGWYNDRVKNQALKSLPLISEDPTERMISVIKSPGYTYDVKLAALQSVDAASVSADSKSQAALAAFNESWLASTNDVRLRGFLNSMRKTSMRMIRENGCSDSAVYPLLEKSYNQFATHAGGDRDEALDAIVTLRTLATDDAVQMLSKFLMNINGRLQSKTLTRNDEDLVREIIPAIGATKLAGGRTALNTVNALDWPSAVKALANDALSQLP